MEQVSKYYYKCETYTKEARSTESITNVVQTNKFPFLPVSLPFFTGKSSPVTGPEWPRGFQEVKIPRFRDNGTGWW